MARTKLKRLTAIFVAVIIISVTYSSMPVYADEFSRPDGDDGVRWVNGIGDPPCDDLTTFDCVDEVTRDDSDYIQTVGLGNNGLDIQEYSMSDISDPLQSNGHFLRYTLREGNEGTNPVRFEIDLLQGTTVIATFSQSAPLPTTFQLFQHELTTTQADSITDYTQLRLELRGICDSGCGNKPSARERVAVSWIEFAVETSVQPPTLNVINNVDPTTLQLFWTEPLDTSQITSYNIERDDGAGFNVVGNVPVGTTTFIDSGLQLDFTYTYRLVSVSPSGNSVPSNEITKSTTITVTPPDFARPDSDPDLRWVNGIGDPPCTDLDTFNCVDEVIRNDTDYIQTIGLGNGGEDTQYYTMSDISDPLQSTGHVLRYTISEANEGTNPVALTIELRQGPAVIATFVHPQGSLPSVFTEVEQVLTTTQADSITDYSGLELTLIGSCEVGCGNSPSDRERVKVSWIEFEIVFPPVNISTEFVGDNSILVSWEVPLNGASASEYIVSRSENSGSFVQIATVNEDSEDKIISRITQRQIYFQLDNNLNKGSSYVYKVDVPNFHTLTSSSLFLPTVTHLENTANGNLIEPETPLTPFSSFMIFFTSFFNGLLQYADAETVQPMFNSTVNPKNEPYLVDLTPIEQPEGGTLCEQILEIKYNRSEFGGQDFLILATILENSTIVRNQILYDEISNFNTRIFNDMFPIPVSEQTIQNFQDLKVQLDIHSTDDPDPANHRYISIYEVNFYVPSINKAC